MISDWLSKNEWLSSWLADVDVERPDEKSIMTYVAQFYKAFPETGKAKSLVR